MSAVAHTEAPQGDPFALAVPEKPEEFPLPWTAKITAEFDRGPFINVDAANRTNVLHVCALKRGKEVADLIVTAVNSHDALVEALRIADSYLRGANVTHDPRTEYEKSRCAAALSQSLGGEK